MAEDNGKTISVHLGKEDLEDYLALCDIFGMGTSKMLRQLIDNALIDIGAEVEKAISQVKAEALAKETRLRALKQKAGRRDRR